MLKFDWLEELVKTGAVREEVAVDIFNNCTALMGSAITGDLLVPDQLDKVASASALADVLQVYGEVAISDSGLDKEAAPRTVTPSTLLKSLQRANRQQAKSVDVLRKQLSQATKRNSQSQSKAMDSLRKQISKANRSRVNAADKPKKVVGLWDSLRQGAAMAMPPLLVGTGIAGVGMAHNKYQDVKLKHALETSFQKATSLDRPGADDGEIHRDPEKTRSIFNTLVHFAPEVATDHNAANAFIRKMLAYNDTGINTDEVKNLSEITRNLRDSKSRGGMLTDISKFTGLDKSISTGLDRTMELDLS